MWPFHTFTLKKDDQPISHKQFFFGDFTICIAAHHQARLKSFWRTVPFNTQTVPFFFPKQGELLIKRYPAPPVIRGLVVVIITWHTRFPKSFGSISRICLVQCT